MIATAPLAYYGGSYLPVGLFVIGCGVISMIAVGGTSDCSADRLDD